MSKLKKYSVELKLKAVKAYLSGEGSYRDISRKFGISHHDILRDWVLWYNGHKEFKERSHAKGEIYMTKGRKTTQEDLNTHKGYSIKEICLALKFCKNLTVRFSPCFVENLSILSRH